jgi:hypothetical protein
LVIFFTGADFAAEVFIVIVPVVVFDIF